MKNHCLLSPFTDFYVVLPNGREVHSTRQYALKMSFTDYVSIANSVEMTTVYVDIPENANLLICKSQH